MRSKHGGYTPREAAHDIAIGWLRNAYNGATADLASYDDRDRYERELKKQIAKLHNRLLRDSGLDGSEIGD